MKDRKAFWPVKKLSANAVSQQRTFPIKYSTRGALKFATTQALSVYSQTLVFEMMNVVVNDINSKKYSENRPIDV